MTWVQWDQAIGSCAPETDWTDHEPTARGVDPLAEFHRRRRRGTLPDEAPWGHLAACNGRTRLYYPVWEDTEDLGQERIAELRAAGHTYAEACDIFNAELKAKPASSLKIETDRPKRLAAAAALCDACPALMQCRGKAFRLAGCEKDVVFAGLSWNARKKLIAALRRGVLDGVVGIPRGKEIVVDADGRPVQATDATGAPLFDAAGQPVWQQRERIIGLEDARLGSLGPQRPCFVSFETRWQTSAGRPVVLVTFIEHLAQMPAAVTAAFRGEAERRGHVPEAEDHKMIVRTLRFQEPRIPLLQVA